VTISAILQQRPVEVYVAGPDETISAVAARLAEKRIGALPVVIDGKVLGIFSERDLIYGLAREGAALLDRHVRDVMTSPAITISPDMPVLSALSLMTKRRIRHLPVIENDSLVALVSIGDLVKFRIEHIESEAEAMRSYIQMA
jgi:CBS domain-containing protein